MCHLFSLLSEEICAIHEQRIEGKLHMYYRVWKEGRA